MDSKNFQQACFSSFAMESAHRLFCWDDSTKSSIFLSVYSIFPWSGISKIPQSPLQLLLCSPNFIQNSLKASFQESNPATNCLASVIFLEALLSSLLLCRSYLQNQYCSGKTSRFCCQFTMHLASFNHNFSSFLNHVECDPGKTLSSVSILEQTIPSEPFWVEAFNVYGIILGGLPLSQFRSF